MTPALEGSSRRGQKLGSCQLVICKPNIVMGLEAWSITVHNRREQHNNFISSLDKSVGLRWYAVLSVQSQSTQLLTNGSEVASRPLGASIRSCVLF
jgi:hypothetical protein